MTRIERYKLRKEIESAPIGETRLFGLLMEETPARAANRLRALLSSDHFRYRVRPAFAGVWVTKVGTWNDRGDLRDQEASA